MKGHHGAAPHGKFITLEGGEGAGKSTQAALLGDFLRQRGLTVMTTREPGGTAGAEAIRRLLVDGAADRWDAWTEALLMIAARQDHVARLIQPALADGAWIVCDRFTDSTLAYQGVAGGLGRNVLRDLMATVLDGCQPDLTLIVDLPVADACPGQDNVEVVSTGLRSVAWNFHENVRQGFLDIAAAEPARCHVIDGRENIGQVAEQIKKVVLECLFQHG